MGIQLIALGRVVPAAEAHGQAAAIRHCIPAGQHMIRPFKPDRTGKGVFPNVDEHDFTGQGISGLSAQRAAIPDIMDAGGDFCRGGQFFYGRGRFGALRRFLLYRCIFLHRAQPGGMGRPKVVGAIAAVLVLGHSDHRLGTVQQSFSHRTQTRIVLEQEDGFQRSTAGKRAVRDDTDIVLQGQFF